MIIWGDDGGNNKWINKKMVLKNTTFLILSSINVTFEVAFYPKLA
jgi:hypothetical protein|nr:MAG TPA_asm: hypothetical protein [Bacteriophage sp.]